MRHTIAIRDQMGKSASRRMIVHRLKPQQVILRTLFDAQFKPGISTGRAFGSSDRAHYC